MEKQIFTKLDTLLDIPVFDTYISETTTPPFCVFQPISLNHERFFDAKITNRMFQIFVIGETKEGIYELRQEYEKLNVLDGDYITVNGEKRYIKEVDSSVNMDEKNINYFKTILIQG